MSFMISTACVRLKMPGVAKNVLMQLAEIANDHGFAFPSIDYLCMRTCWGRSAVIEALKYLEEKKVIWPDRASGRNTTYWVTPANWEGEIYPEKDTDPSATRTGPPAGRVRQTDYHPSASRTPPVRQTDPTRPPAGPDPSASRTLVSINTIELNTPLPPKGDASGFDDFWKTFPKKSAEARARRQWAELAPDAALRLRIVDAVRAQAASDAWQRDGGRWVPLASSWLRDQRWQDEVAEGGDANGAASDGDSRASVERTAAQLGIAAWDSLDGPWHVYKARVHAEVARQARA
ncbi:Helix-turn-helix domain-containing protein [Polaromonas sp. OV174]|uniref:helix-turn-helix domain-containing protein n=1 Tax=Polaromonas sp. OV174 TaxID=1855300 RepID=UPI0008E73612|nr:helix-turn-helix domain-containing protein [Polaromonas sp. OV174]SFB96380.1 Helix-turn-helix domain-containing protein [Polaromonas sp. OV174]